MAWGWGEIIDTAIKLLAPVASSAASTAIGAAMAPTPKAPTGMGAMNPTAAMGAGATAAGAGKVGNAPTSMNFQGGFTGTAPADPAQGPKPISSGFGTIDEKKKDPAAMLGGGGGFEGV